MYCVLVRQVLLGDDDATGAQHLAVARDDEVGGLPPDRAVDDRPAQHLLDVAAQDLAHLGIEQDVAALAVLQVHADRGVLHERREAGLALLERLLHRLELGDVGDRGQHRRPAAEGHGARGHQAPFGGAVASPHLDLEAVDAGPPWSAGRAGAPDRPRARRSPGSRRARARPSSRRSRTPGHWRTGSPAGRCARSARDSGTPSAIARKRSSRSSSSTWAALRSVMSVAVSSIASWPPIMIARADRSAHMIAPSTRRSSDLEAVDAAVAEQPLDQRLAIRRMEIAGADRVALRADAQAEHLGREVVREQDLGLADARDRDRQGNPVGDRLEQLLALLELVLRVLLLGDVAREQDPAAARRPRSRAPAPSGRRRSETPDPRRASDGRRAGARRSPRPCPDGTCRRPRPRRAPCPRTGRRASWRHESSGARARDSGCCGRPGDHRRRRSQVRPSGLRPPPGSDPGSPWPPPRRPAPPRWPHAARRCSGAPAARWPAAAPPTVAWRSVTSSKDADQAQLPGCRIDQTIGGLLDDSHRPVGAAQAILERVGPRRFGRGGSGRSVALPILRIDPLEQRRRGAQQLEAICERRGHESGRPRPRTTGSGRSPGRR